MQKLSSLAVWNIERILALYGDKIQNSELNLDWLLYFLYICHNLHTLQPLYIEITIDWVQKLNKGDISKQKFIDYTEKWPFMVFF